MTFREAAFEATVRFVSLNVALLVLTIPAKILRTIFFPDGLGADVVLVVIMLLICASMLLLVTYVAKPMRVWWADRERELRAKLEQL